MAVFSTGTILGPIMGPALGGWLTYEYSWRWVFFINLPVGMLCILGNLIFIRQTRYVHREPFDFIGFLTLSLGIGALQLMLDRGELKDLVPFERNLDRGDGRRARLLPVYRAHGNHRRALVSQPRFIEERQFRRRHVLVFCAGLIQSGVLALLPTMLQNLMNYPAVTAGLVAAARGIGAMAALFLVAPLINRVDNA